MGLTRKECDDREKEKEEKKLEEWLHPHVFGLL